MRWFPILIVAAGCSGPMDETTLTELRVIAIHGEPPVIDLLNGSSIMATVFRPDGASVDALVWTCTENIVEPDGCLEATHPRGGALTEWTSAQTLDAGALIADVGLDSAGGIVRDETSMLRSTVWALACEPGLCDIIDEVRARPDLGTPLWQHVVAQLSDPLEMMRHLPIQGTALSFKGLATLQDSIQIPVNPIVRAAEPMEGYARPGQQIAVSLSLDDVVDMPISAFPMSSIGGFADIEMEPIDGTFETTWFAPEPKGADAALLLVAVEADDGGSTLWCSTISLKKETVAPPLLHPCHENTAR